MTSAIACATLAVTAWLIYAAGSGSHFVLVFAIVWTAMSAAYVARTWKVRNRDRG